MRKELKLFLASSINELAKDRTDINSYIAQLNKEHWRNCFVNLYICEETTHSVELQRSQNNINQEIRERDIFVLLFHTQVGKITEEEFDVAYDQFKKTGNPKVFIFRKTLDSNASETAENNSESVEKFIQKIKDCEQYYNTYKTIDGLKLTLREQLDQYINNNLGATQKIDLDQQNARYRRQKRQRDHLIQMLTKQFTLLKEFYREVRDYIELDLELTIVLPTVLDNDSARTELANVLISNQLTLLQLLKIFDYWLNYLIECDACKQAGKVKQLVYLLMPYLVDQSIIDFIETTEASVIIESPIATSTVAELVMARIDNKEAEFIDQQNAHMELCGENNILNLLKYEANAGICPQRSHLDKVERFLLDKYSGLEYKGEDHEEVRRDAVKRILPQLDRTLYCVYRLSENEPERNTQITLLQQLANRFESWQSGKRVTSLQLIALSDNEHQRNDEWTTYYLLRKIHTTQIKDET